MKIFSPDFGPDQALPRPYGCEHGNRMPNLLWEQVPVSARSLALVCEDPDAPAGPFVHWLVMNIPPDAKGIVQGVLPPRAETLPNSSGEKEYMGPCPPSGVHHYFFKLYALDAFAPSGLNRKNYATSLAKHTLAKAEIMGTYSH